MIIDWFFLLLGPKRFATYFPYKDFASKTTMSNGRNINRQRLKVKQERLKQSGIVGYLKKLECMISNLRKGKKYSDGKNDIGNIVFIQDFGPIVLDKDDTNNECLSA